MSILNISKVMFYSDASHRSHQVQSDTSEETLMLATFLNLSE